MGSGGSISSLKIKVNDDFSKTLREKLKQAGSKTAHTVAVQIAKDTEPFVPARTKSLVNRTQVVENQIVYPGPYARYLYYGKVMVDAATGKGPMRIVGKDGSEVIRFRKGATLKPTEKPLKISKAVHAQATDHWFDASKAQNLDKWIQKTERAVERELGK